MALDAVLTYALHLLFAGLWTGSVLFAAVTVPALDLSGRTREAFASRFRNVSRASSLLLLLSGGYMLTLAGYTEGNTLTGTGNGHLVLGMVVLWLALSAVVEIAGARIGDGEDASGLLYLGASIAVLLLLDAGALAAGGF